MSDLRLCSHLARQQRQLYRGGSEGGLLITTQQLDVDDWELVPGSRVPGWHSGRAPPTSRAMRHHVGQRWEARPR